MPYARTTYTLNEVKQALEGVDTAKTQGAQLDVKTGIYKQSGQPKPHGEIHAADELHKHPLFAKARVQLSVNVMGGGAEAEVGTHSVMDETAMLPSLVNVMNSPGMQHFLGLLDAGNESASANVNLTATPGNCTVYKTGHATTNQAVIAYFIKLRRNPGNSMIPIIQTCVPRTQAFTAGQLVNKKGVVTGCTC